MTISELVALLKRRLVVLIVVPIAAAALAAAYCTLFIRPVYSANATLYVLVSSQSSDSSLSGDFSVSQQIANDISQLASSQRMREETARVMGVSTLASYSIYASNTLSGSNSRIVTLVVTGPDPEQAARIANAASQALSDIASEVMGVESVNLIDEALVPASSSGTSTRRYVAYAAAAALLVSAFAVLVADRIDPRVRGAKDAVRASGAMTLGRLPRLGRVVGTSVRMDGRGQVAIDSFLNAIGVIRTNLFDGVTDEPVRSLVVTSSVEGEGASTLSCALAESMAAEGSTVLLVDANFRAPSLSTALGEQRQMGLVDVMEGRVCLEDAAQPLAGAHGLFFLDTGRSASRPISSRSSRLISTLICHAERQYDFVIFDAPSILPFADASVLASVADATLVVVRERGVLRSDLSSAMEQLRKVGARTAGIVLNGSSARLPGGRADVIGHGASLAARKRRATSLGALVGALRDGAERGGRSVESYPRG